MRCCAAVGISVKPELTHGRVITKRRQKKEEAMNCLEHKKYKDPLNMNEWLCFVRLERGDKTELMKTEATETY